MRADEVKLQNDLRDWVRRDLGEPKRKQPSYWTWPCPFHTERTPSFQVYTDHWRCFGACGEGGDIFSWLMRWHHIPFYKALQMLGGELEAPERHQKHARPEWHESPAEPPNAAWRGVARKVVAYSKSLLWSDEGKAALAYLRQERGLWPQTIFEAHLGYNPTWLKTDWIHPETGRPAYLPPGITIPWYANDRLWGIRVRCRVGNLAGFLGIPEDTGREGQPLDKYLPLKGGSQAKGLYGVDCLLTGWPALFVEGEFDALIAWQEGMDLMCPVTLGSAQVRLNPRWIAHLVVCSPIYVCYDVDEAGDKGAAALAALTARARRVQVPAGKDLTDFYRTGASVHQWLNELLSGQGGGLDYGSN